MYRVFAVLLLGAALFAQTKVDLARQTGNVDFTGLVTKPFQSGAALPGTCTLNQMFWLTTATAGQNLYGCTATNTWTLEGGAGGGTPGGAANSIQTNVSGALGGNAGDTLDTNGNEVVRGSVTTGNAGTASGVTIQKGMTSGQAGLGVNDVAGNMHIGLFPTAAPTANQVLSVSALNVTCPTNPAYSGLQCDQLAWATGGGVTVSGYYTTIGSSKYCSTPIQICTPASGLTILNTVGSSAVNSTGGTQVLQSAPVATDNIVFAGGAISGGNTTGIIAVSCFEFPGTGQTGWPRCGVGLRESSTGKMLVVDIESKNSSGPIANIMAIESWNTQTSFNTQRSGAPNGFSGSQLWVKFTCSVAGCQSGTITLQASADGINYSAGYASISVTTDFTTGPNQWGVFGSPASTSDAMYVPIQSYVIQ